MGRKRSGKGQHFYRSIAGMMLSLLVACATSTSARVQAPDCPKCPECPLCGHLKPVESMISKGNFDGAMKESQEILARSPKAPPGDEALMSMGLISAHYANPKKDYKKASSYFMRMEREFPRSPLVEEAKIWVGVLQAFEKAKQVDLEIEEMKKGLGK
jgi:outer membrane protein assembly factor BamD (BamD/ComL family)